MSVKDYAVVFRKDGRITRAILPSEMIDYRDHIAVFNADAIDRLSIDGGVIHDYRQTFYVLDYLTGSLIKKCDSMYAAAGWVMELANREDVEPYIKVHEGACESFCGVVLKSGFFIRNNDDLVDTRDFLLEHDYINFDTEDEIRFSLDEQRQLVISVGDDSYNWAKLCGFFTPSYVGYTIHGEKICEMTNYADVMREIHSERGTVSNTYAVKYHGNEAAMVKFPGGRNIFKLYREDYASLVVKIISKLDNDGYRDNNGILWDFTEDGLVFEISGNWFPYEKIFGRVY